MFVTWLPLPAFESKAEESLGAKHPATWESLVVEWWVMVALRTPVGGFKSPLKKLQQEFFEAFFSIKIPSTIS